MIGITALSLVMQRAAPKLVAAGQAQRAAAAKATRAKNGADAKILRRSGMTGTKAERSKARTERAAVLKARGLKDSPQLRGNLTKAHAEGARGRADERAAGDHSKQAARTMTGDKARRRSDEHRGDFAAKSQAAQKERADSAATKRENATTKGHAAGDNARADAEQRKQDSAQHREDAQERSKAKREESAAKGRNASDDARKRAEKKAAEDEAAQGTRTVNGEQRRREARDRAEQRSEDFDTSHDLGVTQKQVREERAWQQQRAGAVQEAVRSVVKDTAGLGPLPGGHILQQAKIAAAVVSADATFQIRTIRPILRDRSPAAAQARLAGSFSRLEEAMTALAS